MHGDFGVLHRSYRVLQVPDAVCYLGDLQNEQGKGMKRGTKVPTIQRECNMKGVLFDLDGTLTRPGALDFPSIRAEINCPPHLPVLEFIQTQPPGQRIRLFQLLEKREEAAALRSSPNKGAVRCLSALKERGIPMGIITRNSLQSVRSCMVNFHGIELEDFSAIITRADSLPKPHPDGVLKAALRMGIPVQELLLVGDFRFDIIAGKAAGARTVLLTNDGRSAMSPEDPRPDHVVGRLDMILDLL